MDTLNLGPIIPFHGCAAHGAMLWSVENLEGVYNVVESYDNGVTWRANCSVGSLQEGYDFIASWFAQFYE